MESFNEAPAVTTNEIKGNGGGSKRPLEANNNHPGLATGHANAPTVKVAIH